MIGLASIPPKVGIMWQNLYGIQSVIEGVLEKVQGNLNIVGLEIFGC